MAESETDTVTDEEARAAVLKQQEEAAASRQARDTDMLLATADVPITAKDALGVERIVLNSPAGYESPQVEPDPKEVERLAALRTRLDNRQQERLNQLTARPDGSGQVAADAIKAESESAKPAPATPARSGSHS